MTNQFYLNQKVRVKAGSQMIKGAVRDIDKDQRYYLIQTEYGTQLLEPKSNIEPDYDANRFSEGYKAF
ncbi:MAG: hypothetical protein IPO21_18970 [Bacteroidales bacterium]|nr:hypothetical protein [Bacteroidales bacterium]